VNECGYVVLLKAWFSKDNDGGTAAVSGSRDDLLSKGIGVATVADDAATRGRDAIGS
jgi:hypothetical protein